MVNNKTEVKLKDMKKADLIKLYTVVEQELVKVMAELEKVQKEYDRYKALKSGQIGHGATRNPNA